MLAQSGKAFTDLRFDDLTTLDKPNIDWVITQALSDVRHARSLCFSMEGKSYFINSVDALIEVASYYWIVDADFKWRMVEIENWKVGELRKYPSGAETDMYGRSLLDLSFEVAQKKMRLVMESIVKSTKKIPVRDEI